MIGLQTATGIIHFIPQPFSVVGILFSPMVSGWSGRRVGGRKSLSGLYLRNRKVYEIDTWLGHWLWGVGVQHHGVILIIPLTL